MAKPFMSQADAEFAAARILEEAAAFNAEYGEAFRQFREFAADLRQPASQPQIDEEREMKRVLEEANQRRITWQEKR
jgi:hypothetical protein